MERLKRSASGLHISFCRRIKMLLGILYGPTDLFLSRDDMMSVITSLLVELIKNEFLHSSLNQNSVYESICCFFGHRSEIIVKGVSNITRVSSNINRKGSRNIR